MESKRKINKIVPISLGILILFTVAGYYLYEYISKTETNYQEEKLINDYVEETTIEDIVEIDENPIQDEQKQEDKTNYTMILEIPKIGLKKGLCSIGQECNAVSKNIKVINKSNMPDQDKGVLILAGHNGNTKVSFFNKLDKLNIGNSIYIYYQGIKYEYRLNNTYDIKKTGKAVIHRDNTQNTIVLITCKKNTKDKQVVYVAYLNNKSNY